MSISRTIAKNTTYNSIGSLLDLGIAFIAGILVTRGLGTEQYGIYAYTVWLLTLTNLFTNLGLGEMSRRFIPEAIGRQNTREAVGYVQLSFISRSLTGVIVLFIVLVSSGYWADQGGQGNNFLFVIVALTVIPSTIQDWLASIFKGFQRFDYTLYIGLAIYPLRLGIIGIFMVTGLSVLNILIINIATFCLGITVGLILLRRLVPLKSLFSSSLLSRDQKIQALKYSLTITGMLILGYFVSHRAEVYFVGLYCSVDDVGFYSLAFRVGSLAGIFPLAFSYVLLPVVAEQFGSGKTEKLKDIYIFSSRYLMMIAFPIAIGGIALADSLIIFIFGAEYTPAVILFQIISLPIAVSSLNSIGDSVIRGINRPGYLLITHVFLSIINVGLCFWLIPEYGVLGAAVASSVPLVLNFPLYTFFLNKQMKAPWPVRDTIKIILASLVMGIVVYFLHRELNMAVGLISGILLGIIVYIIALLVFGEIGEQDLVIFKRLGSSLPPAIKKYYVPLIGLLERTIKRARLFDRR